ncbi:hypothetical protein E2986_12428 [Frieseomelitta varia]|uniref:Ubiquitin-related modifier 1 homolog n=1 Tax=Frieseomelitta varia TaxID=561572 RepID=A0A833VWH8_9HYME|nr:hypothetical protein E2986_12428 [Frieseomelitta varia]
MSIESNGISVIIELGSNYSVNNFRGGAELLFDKRKKHSVNLPGSDWTIQKLLFWMKDNLLKERPELFMQDDTVRPGILVLINDTDWELLVNHEIIFYYNLNNFSQ